MVNKIIKEFFRTIITVLIVVIFFFICMANIAHADSIGIDSTSITGYDSIYTYEGRPIMPELKVKLKDVELEKGIDYDIVYNNNVNVGKATISIIGIGNYTGEKTISFSIVKADFHSVVKGIIPDQYYTSQEIIPIDIPLYNSKSNVRLIQDEDFAIVEYKYNVNVGNSAYIRVVSKNTNYTSGELIIPFNIVPQKMENCTIDTILPVLCDGKAKEPLVIVRSMGVVLSSKEYTVTYSNNVNIGEATVIVTGGHNCPGIKTTTFKIQAAIQSSNIFISNAGYLLGKPVRPKVVIKNGEDVLQEDKDYKMVFLNNTQVGMGVVKISGVGNYTGTVQKEFLVLGRNVRQLKFSKIEEYTYSGEIFQPLVSISFINTVLTENTDYTLSYANNKLPGYGYIIIKGQGNYRGTVKIPFIIKPAQTTIYKCYAQKSSGINLSWKNSASNCGYEIYRNGKKIATTIKTTYKDSKKLVRGKKYEYTIKVVRKFKHEGKTVIIKSESSNMKTVKYI